VLRNEPRPLPKLPKSTSHQMIHASKLEQQLK
jgi:hypothetical protein